MIPTGNPDAKQSCRQKTLTLNANGSIGEINKTNKRTSWEKMPPPRFGDKGGKEKEFIWFSDSIVAKEYNNCCPIFLLIRPTLHILV